MLTNKAYLDSLRQAEIVSGFSWAGLLLADWRPGCGLQTYLRPLQWSASSPGHDGKPHTGSQSLDSGLQGQACCRLRPVPVLTGAPSGRGFAVSLGEIIAPRRRGATGRRSHGR